MKENNFANELKHAVTDNSESINKKAPGTSFSLVASSYLGVLAIVCAATGFLIWFFR